MDKQHFSLLGISLVVCRNSKGEYLSVLENHDQGWWLPGGLVDPPETYQKAAIRETIEEAAINVRLWGILRCEQSCQKANYQRFKVVFYAQPIDENQPVKTKPDQETQCSKWIPYTELEKYHNIGPGWRGPELLNWAKYIEEGGYILPMSFLTGEGAPTVIQQPFTIKDLPLK